MLLKNYGKVIFAIVIGVLVSNIIPLNIAPTQMIVSTELNSTAPAINVASMNIVALTTVVTMITPPAAQAMPLDTAACSVARDQFYYTSKGWNWLCMVSIYIESLRDRPGDTP